VNGAMDQALLAATLLLPLAIAAMPIVRGWRDWALRLLPLAPLPGLAAVLLVADGTALVLPDLLLGARLAIGDRAPLFLLMGRCSGASPVSMPGTAWPTTHGAAVSLPSGA
jgi:hypothetical protein